MVDMQSLVAGARRVQEIGFGVDGDGPARSPAFSGSLSLRVRGEGCRLEGVMRRVSCGECRVEGVVRKDPASRTQYEEVDRMKKQNGAGCWIIRMILNHSGVTPAAADSRDYPPQVAYRVLRASLTTLRFI
jgi:hypothetical protein